MFLCLKDKSIIIFATDFVAKSVNAKKFNVYIKDKKLKITTIGMARKHMIHIK